MVSCWLISPCCLMSHVLLPATSVDTLSGDELLLVSTLFTANQSENSLDVSSKLPDFSWASASQHPEDKPQEHSEHDWELMLLTSAELEATGNFLCMSHLSGLEAAILLYVSPMRLVESLPLALPALLFNHLLDSDNLTTL